MIAFNENRKCTLTTAQYTLSNEWEKESINKNVYKKTIVVYDYDDLSMFMPTMINAYIK